MGKELNSEWYNEVFSNGGSEKVYFLKYSETPWYPVWKKIVSKISNHGSTSILDIGCGPGQFANCVIDSISSIDYVGIDFSNTAISFANQLNLSARFIVADATNYDYSSLTYDIVVITEFLEHIHDDILILEKLKPGSIILATLPNMDSEGHVRFLSKDYNTAISQIKDRYSKICEIKSIEYFEYLENPENGDFLIEMHKL